ncbi:MAG: metal-dependent hydrolase [Caldilineaceae bacterium]|nr:metal-dependent hydrolase [Caldilineaceae bacterium]
MPSPIAHIAVGYAIYRICRSRPLQETPLGMDGSIRSLAAIVGLSLLPDLDAIPGLLLGDLDSFHNNLTHSIVAGVVAALAIGGIVWLKNRTSFVRWFNLTLISYQLHILMDFFTRGRGVMLFWPFTEERFEPAIKLFYGVQRSRGWLTMDHVWMLFNELLFAGALLLILYLFPRVNNYLRRLEADRDWGLGIRD